MVLSEHEIAELCKATPPLIEGFINWEQQLQPGGFDLTLAQVFSLAGRGTIYKTPGMNIKAARNEILPDDAGMFHLEPGYYVVSCNEIVSIPKNIVGYAHTRSTLLRYGANVITGVWDPGFCGHSQCGLLVANEHGITIEKDSAIMQMTFHVLTSETVGFKYNYLYEHGMIV